MKRNNIIILLAVLGVLLIIGGVRQLTQPPSRDLTQEAQLVPVVEGVEAGQVSKLELYSGAKPEEKVILEYDQESGRWRAASHYNAPADAEKVEEVLDILVDLKGEFRVEGADDSDFEDFNLTENKALHVKGYTEGSEGPAFALLAGKSPKYQTGFVRKADQSKVLVVDVDLRNKAGIYGEDWDTAPEAAQWIDKTVVDLEKDKIRMVDLTMPDKHLRFEQVEVEQPKEESSEDAASQSEDTESEGAAAAEETEPAEPEMEWTIASGGPRDAAFKQAGLDAILRKLDSFLATDVVDPAKEAEWGLDSPRYKAIVKADDLDEDVIIEGGQPDPQKEGYIRVASAGSNVVYKVSKYNFEQLFPKGNTLFDLPANSFNVEEVARIEITQPEGKVSIVKEEDAWNIVQPVADFDVLKSKVDTVARTLATWRAADYADGPPDPGFEGPEAMKAEFYVGEDLHTLRIGAETARGDGRYARLDSSRQVLASSVADITKIFSPPKELYQRDIFDVTADDITRVELGRTEDAFVLEQVGDVWELQVAGEVIKTKEDAVEDMLWALEDLQATDLIFDAAELGDGTGQPFSTLTITLKEQGDPLVLRIEPEVDGGHPAFVSTKTTPFMLAKEDVAEIVPPVPALRAVVEQAEDAEGLVEDATENMPVDAVEQQEEEVEDLAEDAENPNAEEAPPANPNG